MWHPTWSSLLTALLLLAAAHGAVAELPARAPQEVDIEVTHPLACKLKTQNGDRISVHYTGALQDGTVFDTSYRRNRPIEFTLGYGEVIPGWEQGLLDMCEGEARTLTIPPSLAYGNHATGMIPAGSTLIFETELVAIARQGVDAADFAIQTAAPEPTSLEGEEAEEETDEVTPTVTVPVTSGSVTLTTGSATLTTGSATLTTGSATTLPIEAASQQPVPQPTGDPSRGNKPGSVDGECRLLGPFALIVQAGLGLLAVSSLIFKRWRERPRRPFKVWFFDASKQVFGSALLHVLNLLMSIFTTADFEIAHKAQELTAQLQNSRNQVVNPCSWYLINIAIDTTIGIPILVIFLRLLHHGAALTPLARPRESIKSGHYGQPPRVTWWLKQSLLYFIGLGLMKLCVFFLIQLLPWMALVGDWALKWTEGSEALQVAFVMFVFPLVMNALQYYIIDSFIKDPAAAQEGDSGEGSQPSYHSVDTRDSIDSDRSERDGLGVEDEADDGGKAKEGTAMVGERPISGSSSNHDLMQSREDEDGSGEHTKQV